MPHRVMMVFGTRPEAIKMAPLAHALRQAGDIDLHICVTGQHREMLHQVLHTFELQVEEDLQLMTQGQTLNGLTQQLLVHLDQVYGRVKPDLVLVHGDTTSSFGATLAAFHRRIPVAHIEAGLRTGNLRSPWPEEANRRLTGVLADLHFAPTPVSRDNLQREGVPHERVEVTGNTVIDALLWMHERLQRSGWQPEAGSPLHGLPAQARVVLITGHRRENFGAGFARICAALAQRYPQVCFVYPVHLNPQVQQAVYGVLDGHANVLLIDPLDYRTFVWLMDRASLILTDSGGVQEEAPSLGKPVLVLRDTTEQPEAVEAGTVHLVGTDPAQIVAATARLLDDEQAYARMSQAHNPYGDGRASARIVAGLQRWLRDKRAT
ncbi:non-hydrolyzing UDP-N-acetylglucosamine 2-epimerase [Phytopseudomonas dryadis]|uniref:UDP-N-acetylglucosamine 2-epimerase (non-hydrolyzing) n=1 Tax=Phytopseudomonas dryadis TaxID=2487520 RepID=A0A4Q9QU44_9GAMM|nr:UDP-N-acetylglucosamine 2-epimerase (non-hydrolyzing) [Pseudomonas dryadis]TBU86556.1 UDP-N-acetylglucosamine 2-epimerase (non-hydrolyzing) [Pseudomonas dryadis]